MSYVVSGEVVNGGFGKHAVVCQVCQSLPLRISDTETPTFELGLAQRWSVAGNDDEFGLARAQSLECGFVAECDLAGLHLVVSIAGLRRFW